MARTDQGSEENPYRPTLFGGYVAVRRCAYTLNFVTIMITFSHLPLPFIDIKYRRRRIRNRNSQNAGT
jgi:hypothetical protein